MSESGPLSQFFSSDHRRLETLLREATAEPGRVLDAAYAEFRSGLLRHIGMEERLLIPAARRAGGSSGFALFRQIRLDHGAIASLMVPTPTPQLVARLLRVLAPHNELEEGPDGLYATCDRLLGADAERLLAELEAFPRIPTNPHQDGPNVFRHIEETLKLAGR
jgi:Hemerythrin HHE cation binding domain